MLQHDEAQKLMETLIQLRAKAKKTKDTKDIKEFKSHEKLCIEKFKYIVLIKASRYKNFANYEDLVQDGMEGLVKAMRTFRLGRGSAFYWFHRYVDTLIARRANLHTTIRFPLKHAKAIAPHRESALPILIDPLCGPHDILERNEILRAASANFVNLSVNQKKVARLLFGLDSGNPQSITNVCKQLRMSRPVCVKLLDQVFHILKKNIHQ